jgi:hypothetical protein
MMDALQLIILQVFAHLFADFIFQPQSWSNLKNRRIFTIQHFLHFVIVWVSAYLLSFDVGFWRAASVIAGVHLLTDVAKSWLFLRNPKKNYFFIDQMVHLITIIAAVVLYEHLYGINSIIVFEVRTIGIITAVVLCTKPANIIIKNAFDLFSIQAPANENDDQNPTDLPNAGKLIGIAERLIALGLVILGKFEAVGLIIAAKSILRLYGTPKSEYVLVGTLLSFGIAFFAGILIGFL